MISTETQPGITELLEQAGARPRGNRHDCPKCKGYRTVTHSAEAFYCHKCGWKGNAVSLAKELGLYLHIPSAEYRELCQRQERAHEAALRLYAAAHKRQLELQAKLRNLGQMELLAHDTGPTEDSWGILATVYAERLVIEQELDKLESGEPKTAYSAFMDAG